jgi:hypothetical protein
MRKTFLCAHTHHNHQTQIQHAKCVRLTSASFPVQLCRSKAYAKCQCMDLRVAQPSMIRTKQSMHISTHTPYLERARAHAHTPYLERGSAHTPYLERGSAHTPCILQERRQCTKRSYAHIHTTIINHKYSMQSASGSPPQALLQSLLRFLCSCAEATHMQMSVHGLTSCAAIDDSRKVENAHRQYSLQNTLHRNCNLCNER